MNFLNFLTSGAGIFNFGLQNLNLNNNTVNSLIRPIPKKAQIIQNQGNLELNENKSDLLISQADKQIETVVNPIQAELLNHHQQLINQFMHLNIQLLSQKINHLEQVPENKQETDQNDIKSNKKKIKKINTNCGHNDKEHYAKGMCSNCYHKNGRTKKPWKCGHSKLYANGLCQNCYINTYNKIRRTKNSISDNLNSEPSDSKMNQQQEPKIQNQQ